MKKESVVSLLLILTLFFSAPVLVQAQTNPNYEQALTGPTWDHSTVTILITPQNDAAWWNPSYLNSSLRAIDEWNQAITYFAANYSDFAYLSSVRLVPGISTVTADGFDIYVSWIEKFGNVTCEAGLTRTSYVSTNIITSNTLTCSAYDCRGNVLTEVDMQNVFLHELGHCLGLGHSNYTGDTMYFAYALNSPTRALSTLDLYGVATVFRWMVNSTQFNPDSQGSRISSVTLPPNLNYEYLPIPEQDVIAQSALGQIGIYLDSATQFVLQPEVLPLIILAVAALAAYVTLTRSRRRRQSHDNTKPVDRRI